MKKIEKNKHLLANTNGQTGLRISELVEELNKKLEIDPEARLIIKDRGGLVKLYISYNEEIELTVEDAPQLSKNNKLNIASGTHCGCYFCFKIFNGHRIVKWVDGNTTALCPHCDMDTVIPNIDDATFLLEAGERWFCGSVYDIAAATTQL